MPLVTARRGGLVEQVIEQLRATIRDGEWPVGAKIPPEAELATSLEVGRNTVREAVRALAHGGLLEVRRMLEVDAARLAAVRRTDDDVADLRAALATRDAALADAAAGDEDVDLAVRADTDFHALVVRCSHNALLSELYRGVAEAVASSVGQHDARRAGHRTGGLAHRAGGGDRDPGRRAGGAGGGRVPEPPHRTGLSAGPHNTGRSKAAASPGRRGVRVRRPATDRTPLSCGSAITLRGKVVDLAIAVVIGAAFTSVVSAFTTAFLKPLKLFSGGGEFTGKIVVDDVEFDYHVHQLDDHVRDHRRGRVLPQGEGRGPGAAPRPTGPLPALHREPRGRTAPPTPLTPDGWWRARRPGRAR